MNWAARFLILFGLVLSPGLRAQDASTQPENKSGTNAPAEKDLSGWQWANFLVLAGILGYFAVKMGAPYFRNQSQAIGQGLDEARQQRVQAEVRAGEVNRKLENLGTDIEALRHNVLAEQAAHQARMRDRAELEMQRVQVNAGQQIAIAGKQARLELQRYASRLALELAERKTRDRMNPQLQSALTSQFAESLKADAAA